MLQIFFETISGIIPESWQTFFYQTLPDHWLSFIYQYAVGGGFFFLCFFIGLKYRTIDFKSPNGRVVFAVALGGFLLVTCIHATWIYFVTQ